MPEKISIREFYDNLSRKFWSHTPLVYGRQPITLLYDLRERDVVRRLVRIEPSFVVLDLCTGPGRWVVEYCSRGAEIVALDFSTEVLRSNKSKNGFGRNVHYVLGDAEHLPFSHDAFDAISCFDAFPHFPNPRQSLREINRVARPTSVVVIEPSNTLSIIGIALSIVRALFGILTRLTGRPPPIWATSWTKWETIATSRQLLRQAGFSPILLKGVGVMFPPSLAFAYLFYKIERLMDGSKLFNYLGSRVIFICKNLSK